MNVAYRLTRFDRIPVKPEVKNGYLEVVCPMCAVKNYVINNHKVAMCNGCGALFEVKL